MGTPGASPYPQTYKAEATYTDTLKYLNIAFTVLFTIEAILKLIGFGPRVRYSARSTFY